MDYRSKFLIFWTICNFFSGSLLIYLFDNGKVDVIFYIGVFLVIMMVFRIMFALLYKCKAKCDRTKVRYRNRKRVSTIFDEFDKNQEVDKDDVFVIYYDDEGENLR
jgi:hypothetical protein